jgi:hypothetical protein
MEYQETLFVGCGGGVGGGVGDKLHIGLLCFRLMKRNQRQTDFQMGYTLS